MRASTRMSFFPDFLDFSPATNCLTSAVLFRNVFLLRPIFCFVAREGTVGSGKQGAAVVIYTDII